MSSPPLVMAFYVPLGDGLAADEAVARLGIVPGGGFGPLASVDVRTETLDYHVVVEVYFSVHEFFALDGDRPPGADVPLDEDGALPLAIAVRAAAARAGAEVAMVVTHADQANPAWLRDRYWMVIARDPSALAGERFGLLYLDDELARGWVPPWPAGARDELPGAPGRAIFARSGAARWA